MYHAIVNDVAVSNDALDSHANAEGCKTPTARVVEAHFNDQAGAVPVVPSFDADPGEICGNGKTYYCTSRPPKKQIPDGWTPPPKPGSRAGYEGPKPGVLFKESPYAMCPFGEPA